MTEKRKYGIQSRDLENIISILRSDNKIEKAILFGSRAKGNYAPGSDIDIAIKGNDLKLDDLLNVISWTDELSLPYKFDIILYDRVKEAGLLRHIDQAGIVLFEQAK